jgi:hypothetical protein
MPDTGYRAPPENIDRIGPERDPNRFPVERNGATKKASVELMRPPRRFIRRVSMARILLEGALPSNKNRAEGKSERQ